jgi:hypothetical protein
MAKAKKQSATDEAPNFEDDIKTAIHVVTLFRDLLSDETTRITQDRTTAPDKFDVQKHAYLHRMMVSANQFLSALSGVY